ncbi:MAG TPA: DEAD/DEAH box helicase, partial [Chlamydiales bacterium]|nr:DEAD/DEAH box helicase [Chlamydiales bacterium]
FQEIALPATSSAEAVRLMVETGRFFFRGQKIEMGKKKSIFWRGEKHSEKAATLQAFLGDLPLDSADLVVAGWAIYKNEWFAIETQLPWKWIALFRSGKVLLQGAEKKSFLEEDPNVLWNQKEEVPLQVFPQLVLTDASGACANLWMEYTGGNRISFEDLSPEIGGKTRLKAEEAAWEKDLVEAGYLRKIVGNSRYYCSGEKVRDALRLLLEIGWTCLDMHGRRILPQTACDLKIGEKENSLRIEGKLRFQDKEGSLARASKSRLFLELEGGFVGLLQANEIPVLDGEWEGNALLLPKRKIGEILPFLDRARTDWEESLKQAAAALKRGEGIAPCSLTPAFQGQLLPYQQKGVEWLLFLQKWGFGALLSDEMGLGKTVQAVAFFSQLRTNLPILIVAPTSLLFNWQYELNRFWPEATVYVHSGPHRSKILPKAQVILISYALLRIDQELMTSREFEVVALDESQSIKTASSQVAVATCRLKARFKIAISGTPIENRSEELWSQFRFLMPDLFGEKSEFLAASPESLRRKAKPFILRRRKEEVQIELPEKIDHPVWVDWTEEQQALYDQTLSAFKNGLLHKVQEEGLNAHRLEVLEVILRLRQICADPRLMSGQRIGGKAEMLLGAAEELAAEGKKAIVFSQFTTFLRLLEKDLLQGGIEPLYLDGSTPEAKRGEIVRRFQEEEKPHLFLLSLKAGGVGLNLTAAESVFLMDPWWNEAVERQAIDRAHRIGQKRTLFVQRYLTPHSIEEKMLAIKASKMSAAEALLGGEECAWSQDELFALLT